MTTETSEIPQRGRIGWFKEQFQNIFRRGHNLEFNRLNPANLKDYLLLAAKSPNLTTEYQPSSIDLDEFGLEANRMIKLSLADPSHPETGSICYTEKGKLFLLRKIIQGQKTHVAPQFPQGRRIILLMHTHGEIDTPFASGDLEALLIDPKHEKAVAAEILATPTVKLLIIRTKDTPALSAEEVIDATVMMNLHPALEGERAAYQEEYDKAGGDEGDTERELRDEDFLPMTDSMKQSITQMSHKRMYALIRTTQQHHLKIYACPIDKNIVYPIG